MHVAMISEESFPGLVSDMVFLIDSEQIKSYHNNSKFCYDKKYINGR